MDNDQLATTSSTAKGSGISSDDGSPECFLCARRQCDKTCPLCGLWFCSSAHQGLHKDEEGKCYPFHIRTKDGVGRYLVATRDLEPGAIVFKEQPIILGNNHETPPVCLGCLKPLNPENAQLCSKCQIPMCDNTELCGFRHLHSSLECNVFAELGTKVGGSIDLKMMDPHPFYECIAPLRGLLLKEMDPDKWATIQVMVDHVNDRQCQQEVHWEELQHNVVRFLRQTCQLADRFSEDEINHVLGVLEVNAFEITTSEGYRGRGLFPLTALMSHGCLSNTRYIFKGDNFAAECRTNVAVRQGEEFIDHYVTPLNGTRWRRKRLKDGWYFDCICTRCSSPTEAGTHLSSLLCDVCKGTMLCDSPLDAQSGLTCQSCGIQKPQNVIDQLESDLESRLEDIKSDKNLILEALTSYATILHHNHYLMVAMERYLMYLMEPNNPQRLKLALHLLTIYDIITPGLTKERGLTLFEVHSGLLRQIKAALREAIKPDQCRVLLEQCQESLRAGNEALKCLQHEKEDTFEAMIFDLLAKSTSHCKDLTKSLNDSLSTYKIQTLSPSL